MQNHYSIKNTNGITIIHIGKSPNKDDLIEVVDKLSMIENNNARVWDFNDITLDIPLIDIKFISEYVQTKRSGFYYSALVASEISTYGILRAAEVYSEDDQLTTKVFRIKQDALDWISEKLKKSKS